MVLYSFQSVSMLLIMTGHQNSTTLKSRQIQYYPQRKLMPDNVSDWSEVTQLVDLKLTDLQTTPASSMRANYRPSQGQDICTQCYSRIS